MQVSKGNSGVTGSMFTIFSHDAARLLPLLTRPYALKYSNPFGNARAKNENDWANFADFSLNWLSWQRPMSDQYKNVRSIIYDEITTMW